MRKLTLALAVVLSTAVLALPALAQGGNRGGAAAQRGGVTGIHAGVTCHSPCDDPFQIKAWVRGSKVDGLVVRFEVKGKVYKVRTTSSGFAHRHLTMRPSTYPQGVVVTVKTTVKHGGVTRSDTTWFKPNYN